MKTIILLYGGRSGEHEISLISGASVARNLNTSLYSVLLVGITKAGVFYLQDDALLQSIRASQNPLTIEEKTENKVSVVMGEGFFVNGKKLNCDIVFPVLHGTFGEDGTVQALIELAQLPYVGSGVFGSALGMDKEKAKIVWKAAGIPVVPWLCLRKADFIDTKKHVEQIKLVEKTFDYPVFVKPVTAGSSLGAEKASDKHSLEHAIREAFKYDVKVLIEPFVEAREIECSVTGNDNPLAYVPGEIIPSHEFYDYEAKYFDPDGAALVIPARLTPEEQAMVKELACKAYKEAELSGFSRVDFFIDKISGTILLNEVNTIPGFTTISMFPKMCEAGGVSYTKVLDLLINHGFERFTERSKLKYTK